MLLVFLRIYRAYHIQQAGQFGMVQSQPRIIIAGQSSFQRRVVFLHLRQSRINFDSNVVLLGILHQVIPTADFIQIEDVLGIIEHRLVYKQFLAISNQLIPPFHKTVERIF